MAPFWRGLNDWSDSWAEHQLVAAARGLAIPAADAPPDPELMPRPPPPKSSSSQNLTSLTVPLGPRTLSTASDRSTSGPSSPTAATSQTKSSGPFKPRAKALAAALSMGSRNASSTDLAPKEINLPHDPFVNGQPLEVFIYKDADDCPICFLSYPPYLNRTRCCDQPICSECFVQIKRTDPHLPEHHPDGEARDPSEGLSPEDPPEMLISEPSACPYCQQPEFGVTYDAPPFRRGLAYGTSSSNLPSATAMSSQSSLNSTLPPSSTLQPGSPTQVGRRRTHSLSANAPNVITTDRVRPDWATKLAAARAHQARRSAAATALHTAAFLVGATDQRSILRPSRFSRRNTGANSSPSGARASSTVRDPAAAVDGADGPGDLDGTANGGRRTRIDELEDMMFMEAVRLSLAAEEDRKRKEDKAIRKETKRRMKEQRKNEKKNSKDPYSGGASGASASSLSLGLGRRRGNSAASNLRMEATVQSASQASKSSETSLLTPPNDGEDTEENAGDKGKGIDRGPAGSNPEAGSSGNSLPIPAGSLSRGGSHLRQMSNASSIGSSLADSPSGSYSQGFVGPDGKNPRASGMSVGGHSEDGERDTGSEPMFNFRSLAEMVGVNLEDGTARRNGEDEDGDMGDTDESPSSGNDFAARPLSQVREEEKEDGDAEHVEETAPRVVRHPADDNDEASTSREAKENGHGSGVLTPELTVTPETPALEGEAAESKRLGGPSITEHPTSEQITQ